MKIKIFTTGGTIDKIYFDAKSEYAVGESQVKELLRAAYANVDFEVTSLLRKDSLDLTADDRNLIREKVRSEPCERILVTHGTDTMIETAKLLQSIPDKVIVLTGSMAPARFKSSDAEFNVGFAVCAVQILPPGVFIAMNARIFRPDEVRKNREANRFEPLEH